MSHTAAPPTLTSDAQDVALRAARTAGVQLRELSDIGQMQTAAQLIGDVWGDPTGSILPTNLIRALQSAGNYVAAAFLGEEMVGSVFGLFGLHGDELVVHSHILGVAAAARGRSVGFALKHHQRAWCLERGVAKVVWTFDPLVRRNAYFNFSKLAAVGARYEQNFYGPMTDGINAGDESDRLVVEWHLHDPAVAAAAGGVVPAVPAAGPEAILLDLDDDGAPKILDADGETLRCRIPKDIVELRATRPDLAQRWRHALRDTLGAAVSDGYSAVGMDRDGWYTLTRARPEVR
jgi:predicted GNAT superfamily acetyltransferase